MHRTTFINKNGDVIRDPFYPDANQNNNQRRTCSVMGVTPRKECYVVADFGSRLYVRRIIEVMDPGHNKDVIVKLDDILSVPMTSVSNLY
jgi:hypothetical protein